MQHMNGIILIENKFTRMRAHFTLRKNCVHFFTDF